MSLFAGLAKCESPYCQKYIYEKDMGKFKCGTKSLCSVECVHLTELSEYIDKLQGQLDKNQLMELIKAHLEKFKDELLADSVPFVFILRLGR